MLVAAMALLTLMLASMHVGREFARLINQGRF
jgi:hypothetical protein